MPARLGFW